MTEVKYLVIGGGLAAFHCAKNLRRTDDEGTILMVSEEDVVPYDRPPLSKESMRGEKTLEEITYETEDQFAEQKIDLALGSAVTALDASSKTATLANGDVIHFEKAFLGIGGRVIRIPIPGANLAGVFYLRDIGDAEAIQKEAAFGKKAVVIGAGFIGLETAASLTQIGVEVTVLEALPHIWSRFADEELAGYFQEYCTQRGITFVTSAMATEIHGENGRVKSVQTKDGTSYPCDFVCVGIGIVPNVELAKGAGLAVHNGVVVNEFMQTSDPDIYCGGDVVNYFDPVFERRRRVEHWGHAEYCGQIAGRNMAEGNNTAYDFLTYAWSDIFDLRIETAGDEAEHDKVLVRGNFEDAHFTVLHLKDGVLTSYLAVNGELREFTAWRRLIRSKIDLTGKDAELEDTSFQVRALARP